MRVMGAKAGVDKLYLHGLGIDTETAGPNAPAERFRPRMIGALLAESGIFVPRTAAGPHPAFLSNMPL